MPLRRQDAAFRGGAILAAAAAPGLIFGPAAIGVSFGLAMAMLLLATPPARWWPRVVDTARSPLGVLFGVVVVSWLPSLVVTLNLRLTLEALSYTVGFVAAAVILWAILAEDARTRVLVRWSLLAATALAVAIGCGALHGTAEVLALFRFEGWTDTDAVGRLRSFANAAMLTFPAVLWAGWTGGTTTRVVGTLGAFGLVAVILGTDTLAPLSGVVAAALFAAACVVARARPHRIPAILAMLALVAGLGLALVLLTDAPPVDGVPFDPYLPTWLVDVHRQVIWSFTLDHAVQAPVFGLGINAVDQVEGTKALIPGLGPQGEYLPSHPHSWLLEILAETGVVGTVPFILFVTAWIARLAREHVRTGSPECLAAGAVSSGYWVAGLFNFSFWEAWWQLAHVLLMAVLLAARVPAPSHGSPLSSGREAVPLAHREPQLR